MKPRAISAAFAVTIALPACDAEAAPEDAAVPLFDDDDVERALSQHDAVATVVAEYATEDYRLEFIEAEDPETGEPLIDVAMVIRDGAEDPISPLLDGGATALEVLRHLDPEAPVPPVMRAAHVANAERDGRGPQVRSLSSFRGSTLGNHAICDNYFEFADFMDDKFPGNTRAKRGLEASDPFTARHVWKWATTPSDKDVNVRVCNKNTYGQSGGCNKDRFPVRVYKWGPGPSGYSQVWAGTLYDCDLLRYWWNNRTANTQYGVVLEPHPERNLGPGWHDYDPLQAYIGIGF